MALSILDQATHVEFAVDCVGKSSVHQTNWTHSACIHSNHKSMNLVQAELHIC